VRHEGGVDRDWLSAGTYELEVATERVKASLHLESLYDPRAERVRQ
jgi:4-methylaminobutanoate oxidase (formaldehyde-forming)